MVRSFSNEEKQRAMYRSEVNGWNKVMRDNEFKNTVMSEHTADVVNEPEHYARWEIEPITYIMSNSFDFWRGNIIKYASRAGFKAYDGKTKDASEILDLKKVIRYAEMRINQLNGEEKL